MPIPCCCLSHIFCNFDLVSSSVEKQLHYLLAPIALYCYLDYLVCNLDLVSSSVEKQLHYLLAPVAPCCYPNHFFCDLGRPIIKHDCNDFATAKFHSNLPCCVSFAVSIIGAKALPSNLICYNFGEIE